MCGGPGNSSVRRELMWAGGGRPRIDSTSCQLPKNGRGEDENV